MEKQLNKKVNFLMIYAIISTVLFAYILFSSFTHHDPKVNMDELTLKRLNIVGEDGSLRLVISNENRQHSGRVDGKDQPQRNRPAGILFFNTDGDECGGLLYEVNHKDSTDYSSSSFTMDQYRNDQVIQILNEETYNNGRTEIFRGYRVNEYPKGSTLASKFEKMSELKKIKDPEKREARKKEVWRTSIERTRLFLGIDPDSLDGLFLFDHEGKPRMKIYVDQDGTPRFEIIHQDGTVKDILAHLN